MQSSGGNQATPKAGGQAARGKGGKTAEINEPPDDSEDSASMTEDKPTTSAKVIY